MKTIQLSFISICILVVSFFSKNISATTFCDSLSVTSIQMTPGSPNTLDITIYNGNNNHLNYPYIDYILDAAGDTIADGDVSIFALGGHGSQTYQLSTSLNGLPTNWSFTIFFKYDNKLCTFYVNSANSICDSLSITNIAMDPVSPNILNVTIFSNSKQFIGYPYVDYILDATGDTIAHGQLSSFGQTANSSQTFNVLTTLNSLPANWSFTIFFKYNNPGPALCVFTSSNTVTSIDTYTSKPSIHLYPNPANEIINIDSDTKPIQQLTIHNVQGQILYKAQNINTDHFKIDLNFLSKGMYFIEVSTEESKWINRFIVN